jgi:hypothetical protein
VSGGLLLGDFSGGMDEVPSGGGDVAVEPGGWVEPVAIVGAVNGAPGAGDGVCGVPALGSAGGGGLAALPVAPGPGGDAVVPGFIGAPGAVGAPGAGTALVGDATAPGTAGGLGALTGGAPVLGYGLVVEAGLLGGGDPAVSGGGLVLPELPEVGPEEVDVLLFPSTGGDPVLSVTVGGVVPLPVVFVGTPPVLPGLSTLPVGPPSSVPDPGFSVLVLFPPGFGASKRMRLP